MHRDPYFPPEGRAAQLAGLSTEAFAAAAGALVAITDAHLLTASQRERLESAYRAIGSRMAEHPKLGDVTVEVHPQGSMLIGTTTRPEGKAEMDVDLVLLLTSGLHNHLACAHLLDAVHEALSEHAQRKRSAIHILAPSVMAC